LDNWKVKREFEKKDKNVAYRIPFRGVQEYTNGPCHENIKQKRQWVVRKSTVKNACIIRTHLIRYIVDK
jgi:hypothetical protein